VERQYKPINHLLTFFPYNLSILEENMGKSSKKTHLEFATCKQVPLDTPDGKVLGFEIVFSNRNDANHVCGAIRHLKHKKILPKDYPLPDTGPYANLPFKITVDTDIGIYRLPKLKVYNDGRSEIEWIEKNGEKFVQQADWRIAELADGNLGIQASFHYQEGGKGEAENLITRLTYHLKQAGIMPQDHRYYEGLDHFSVMVGTPEAIEKLMAQDYFSELNFPLEETHPSKTPERFKESEPEIPGNQFKQGRLFGPQRPPKPYTRGAG
jgi:hypothetical protein